MANIKVRHLDVGKREHDKYGRLSIEAKRGPHMSETHHLMHNPTGQQIAERMSAVLERAMELAEGTMDEPEGIPSIILIASGVCPENYPVLGIILVTNDWNDPEEGHELLHSLAKLN